MNNNRCLFCNKIIPEGRQICPKCEKIPPQDRNIKRMFDVTPENDFCLKCKKNKCNGECKEFKAYMRKQGKKVRGKAVY